MSVSNQRIIQNFNYAKCSAEKDKFEEHYAKINLMALQGAMKNGLSQNALKLWLYFSKNKEGFTHLELSRVDCVRNWGIGNSQFDDAFNSLVAKGYLVPLQEDSSWYDFYQIPVSGQILPIQPDSGRKDNPDSGMKYKIVDQPDSVRLEEKCPESGQNIADNPDSGFFDEIAKSTGFRF